MWFVKFCMLVCMPPRCKSPLLCWWFYFRCQVLSRAPWNSYLSGKSKVFWLISCFSCLDFINEIFLCYSHCICVCVCVYKPYIYMVIQSRWKWICSMISVLWFLDNIKILNSIVIHNLSVSGSIHIMLK